jgi:thiamine biosynthesis lipoprotein
LAIADRALATSGGYRRNVTVRGQRRSHLIDPRTGEPVSHTAGVTVLAPEAMTADALSTTFSVLPPDESLRLAEATPGVACLKSICGRRWSRR